MSEQAIKRVLDSLKYRGPDGDDFQRFDDGWIGNTRLSIIDPSGNHQPISNENAAIHFVCNGEIYKHTVLRAELTGRGHRFSTYADVEVFLHLYEEVGEGFLDRLQEMFAFAIWDTRRQRSFAARDPVGQCPFYFSFIEIRFYSRNERVGAGIGHARETAFGVSRPISRSAHRCVAVEHASRC